MFLKPREAGLDVPDDAVESLEDRVGAPMAEVGEDVLPVPAELSGEGLHRFQPRMHHPRAQCLGPGLRLRAVGAVGVDVLQAFAHPARPGGLRPPLRRIALDLRLRVREVGLVPGLQVLRAFEQRALPGLGLADPADGLVGVFDDMDLADGSGRVGQVAADALGESRAHVARHQDAVRVAVERHEIPLANRSTACASLPGVTLVTLRSVRSATTVMHRWPLRLVSSMPIVSTPVQSSYRRASST